MSDPLIWLRGDKTGIGPLRADLVEEYWKWEQSIPTIVGYNRQTPQPLESTREILVEGYGRASDRELRFTVYDLTGESPCPVGLAQVYIDQMRRNGEYVVALGESRGRSRERSGGGAAVLVRAGRAPPRNIRPGK
ncbi:hypothetical protein [Nocardiopsis dassonvillei]|uniref:hypothetical protein n=1 Tax=Nocardiopsis dassonvillei TaxID=2014 RepID=UPI00362C99CF